MFCTFVTREICLCYFSAFLSPGVLRLGWEGKGTEGKRCRVWPRLGPWHTICSLLSSSWGGFREEGQLALTH